MLARCILFLILIFPCLAQEEKLSPIPSPKQEVVNLSSEDCDVACMRYLVKEERYFSLIALYPSNAYRAFNKHFREALKLYVDYGELKYASLNIPNVIRNERLKIALMMPQKSIGRYSSTSADSIISYLMARDIDFEFKAFDTKDESIENLKSTYLSIQDQNYDYIIAILTANGLGNLLENTDIDTPIFVPTVNKNQVKADYITDNVYFGGIDYDRQIDTILDFSNSKNASIISLDDDGVVGKQLGAKIKEKSERLVSQHTIDSKSANSFRSIFSKIKPNIKKSIIVLNTSLVKTGLIIPQIGNTRTMPIAFLSTQVNFNPSLISLMPPEDAKRLFIVSIINPLAKKILETSELMSANLKYDWVNYSTALCVDILLKIDNRIDERFFSEKLYENQIIYSNRFYGIKDSHFIPVSIK